MGVVPKWPTPRGDNAPHHTHLDNFPHHKHIEHQVRLAPSCETCLEDVMEVVLAEESRDE